MKYLLCILALFVSLPLSAQIFKWTDSSGVVHFTDKPTDGAQEITLPPSQTYSNPAPQGQTDASGAPDEKADVADDAPYNSITIKEPVSESTIRNNDGSVPVLVELDPELRKDDSLQLIFDGKPLGKPQNSTIFSLKQIDRGTHTIAVKVLSADGEELNTSDTVTIYLQRPRVGMVPGTRNRNTP